MALSPSTPPGASSGWGASASVVRPSVASSDPSVRTARLVAGMDLGSTGMKLMVADESGHEVVTAQVPTPWRYGPNGTSEMDSASLMNAVHRVMASAAEGLEDRANAHVEVVAISGMGESGVLIGADSTPVAPAFAWFDPRGGEQAAAFPSWVRTEFAGRTGLPLGAQVTASKLAYLRDQGLDLAGLRWLNLPEFVAMNLGGSTAVERSLMSRTGLLDQDTGMPWVALLEELGAGESLLPSIVDAGSDFGHATADALPGCFFGAHLTVAGHDHLVAAEASGPLDGGRYHVSMGTAEVLLRVIDSPLGFEARARLGSFLINEVRHVVPGKHVLVAGVKSGLLLRRVLQAVGVQDRRGRDELDLAVMKLPFEGDLAPGSVEVSGARNDDGVLGLRVRGDGASPAEIFAAALRHSNDEITTLIKAMDREIPPARSSTLTGGWVGMASVRRARGRVLPAMEVSPREQETAYGAVQGAIRLLNEASPRHHTDLNHMKIGRAE